MNTPRGASTRLPHHHQTEESSSRPPRPSPVVVSPEMRMRVERFGSLSQRAMEHHRRRQQQQSTSSEEPEKYDDNDDDDKATITTTPQPPPPNKAGTSGTPTPLTTNYFPLKLKQNWTLYLHSVTFTIENDNNNAQKEKREEEADEQEEDRTFIKKLWFRQAFKPLKIGYMFDGAQLFTTTQLLNTPTTFKITTKKTNLNVQICIKFTKEEPISSPAYIQLYNIIVRKCLYGLKLEQMGRYFYDPKAAIIIRRDRLELWPGYITSLRNHEEELLLCVEVTHKVIRQSSVLETINAIISGGKNNKNNNTTIIQHELVDTIVMTTYNHKTYHIDDIDFSQTPLSEFTTHKGTTMTFQQYYLSRYKIQIKDLTQPLLISQERRTKNDLHRGEVGPLRLYALIPELCQATGLTEGMRSNHPLMRTLNEHLHQEPTKRVEAIKNFIQRINDNPEITKELKEWGIEFIPNLKTLTGRKLPLEDIQFAKGLQKTTAAGDFTFAFRSQQMISTVTLSRWIVLCPKVAIPQVEKFIVTMQKVARPLNFTIEHPIEIVQLPDTRIQEYIRFIEDAAVDHKNLQMIFIILPNNKSDVYKAVKRRLSSDFGIPSQCFLAKNVASKAVMSIASKVVVQMNAKLGGEPWSVKLPLEKTMFIGFDMCKRGGGGSSSSTRVVGAVVGTLSPIFTKYFSTTFICDSMGEVSDGIRNSVLKCLRAYKEENDGQLPEKLIMFRDGVGDGELTQVYLAEIQHILDTIRLAYGEEKRSIPKFTYIMVSKKINTRFFEKKNFGFVNPGVGTIVDGVVTQQNRYDFFLISSTARQGTVSPCSFTILHDTSGLSADKLQLITYKMCHMYFNWAGTVSVPAPVQYAHKLAGLTAMTLMPECAINSKLCKLLHFL